MSDPFVPLVLTHNTHKSSSKYYGPYKVWERIHRLNITITGIVIYHVSYFRAKTESRRNNNMSNFRDGIVEIQPVVGQQLTTLSLE